MYIFYKQFYHMLLQYTKWVSPSKPNDLQRSTDLFIEGWDTNDD